MRQWLNQPISFYRDNIWETSSSKWDYYRLLPKLIKKKLIILSIVQSIYYGIQQSVVIRCYTICQLNQPQKIAVHIEGYQTECMQIMNQKRVLTISLLVAIMYLKETIGLHQKTSMERSTYTIVYLMFISNHV